MATIGVGVVGCGNWGFNYIRVFGEVPQAHMLRACDLDDDRLQRVQRRFPWVETGTDLEALLRDPRIDAVVVSTPSSTHYQVVKQCLQHGKHVLVEKPFVMEVAEGEELVDLAAAQKRTLMIGHTFMYNSGIQKMKECMHENGSGDIYYLHSTRTNLGPIRSDTNALWDLVPHDVSIFGYLLELRPISVSAVGTKSLRNSREDVGFVTLTYPRGILGHIHVSWIDPDKVREVVVVGSNRRIVFNDLNNVEQIRIFQKGVSPVQTETNGYGEFRLQIRDGDIVSPKVKASEPLKNQCIHFLDCIATGLPPLSDGRNGLDVVRVLIAANESVRRNGAPVEVQW